MSACISPILVKHGFVPCGYCGNCLARKRQDWSFRVKQELKRSRTADFLTFTYAEETVPKSPSGLNTLDKSHFQQFMKLLRTEHVRNAPRPFKWPQIRYYTVGEYGTDTNRPHIHSIMFNVHPEIKPAIPTLWDKGLVDFGKVEGASIGYVTGYVINRHGEFQDRQKPFALISKGLGANYLEKNYKYHKHAKRFNVNNEGQPGGLPRYYAEKIFNPHEREMNRVKLQAELAENYRQEIIRLSEFHSDPEAYYLERQIANCEAVKNKATLNHQL